MTNRGFTLIEVTIALIIGGMALSAAAALLIGLGDRADTIRRAGALMDRDANGERLLRGLWGNLRLSGDSTLSARGDSTAVDFQAWCESVEGWLRPCRARLAVERAGAGYRFHLELGDPTARPVALWSGTKRPAGIRYLRDAAHGGSWTTQWSSIVAPPAIAAIMGPDTLILSTW